MTDSNKGLRILIVEDNYSDQYLVTELLSASVIKIQLLTTAGTLCKAIEILQKETFDIILLDLTLPDSAGIGTFATVKKLASKMPVIILSGITDMNIAVEAISLGAQDYLLKGDLDEKVLTKMILYSIERKVNLENLRESEAKYRSMIERNLAGVYQTTPDGKILTCNDAFANMLGYGSHTELLQKKASEFYFLSSDRAGIITQLQEKGGMINKELKLLHKNGTPVHVIESCTLINDSLTGEQIIEGVILDITERQKAEDKIKESELKYRTLMQQAGDSILLFSGSGQLIEANQSARQLLGYSMEEYKNMSLKDLFFEEDIKQNPFRFDLLNKGESTVNRRRLKRKGGAALETEIHAKKLSDGRYLGVGRDLTERIKAEEQFRESEEKYRTLVEFASDGIVIIGINGICIDVNSTICNMLGYAKEELVKKNLFEFVVINKGDVPFRIAEVLAGKSVLQERNVLKKNGDTLPVELNSKLLPDNRILVIVRDISERKRVEEELKSTQQNYSKLINTVEGIVWEADAQTFRFKFVSEQAERLLGYPVEQWVNEPSFWSDHIHPDDRSWVVNFCVKSTMAKEPHEFEYRMIAADGRIVWLRDIVSVIVKNNQPVQLRGLMVDITERRQIEDALRESNERNDIVAKATSDVVWDWDLLTGKVYRSKEGLKKVYGYDDNTPIELVTNWNRQVHPDDRDMMEKLIEKIHQSSDQNTFSVEYRFLRQDGTYANVFDRGYIIRDEKGKPVRMIGAAQNITERKTAEVQIKKQKEQYDDLVKNIPVGVYKFRMKPQGMMSFDYISPRTCEMIGVKEEDAYRDIMNAFKVVYTDDFSRFMKLIEESFLTKQDFLWEGRGIIYDQLKWMKIESSPKVLENGDTLWDGVIVDITERKQAEANQQESKNILRAILDNAPIGIWMQDSDGHMLFVNQAFCSSVGIPEERFLEVPHYAELYDPEVAAACIASDIEASTGPSPHSSHERLLFTDGKMHDLEIIKAMVTQKQNGISGLIGLSIDITERIKGEELLRESEEIFRRLFNESADAVLLLDDTGFTDCNQSAVAIFGCSSKEEILNKKPWDISPEKQPDGRLSAEKAEAMIAKALQQGYNRFEWVHIKSDGTEFPVEVMLTSIILKGKQSFYSLLRDITERKKFEEKILKSEEQYRDLVDNITDLICTHDLEGRVLSVNKAAEKLIGYKFNPKDNLNIKEILTDDTKDHLKLYMDNIQKKGYANGLMKVQTRAGDIRIWEYNNSLKTTGVGTPVVRGYARDITERRKTEDLIKKQKEQYDDLVTNIPVGVFKFRMKPDGSMSLDYISPRLCKMIGIKKESAYGDIMNTFKVVHPDDFSRFMKLIEESYTTRQKFLWEGRSIVNDQVNWVRIESFPKVLKNADILWDGVIADITQSKKAEEEILKTNARFQMLSKATSDIVWDWDMASGSIWWNDNYYSLLGINKGKKITDINDWYSRIHPDDLDRIKKDVEKGMHGNLPFWSHEYRFAKADGTYLHFLDRSFVMHNQDGKPYRIIGSIVNMTPVYAAQKKVAESENRLRTIFESEPECIKVLGSKGELLDMNPSGLAMIEADNLEMVKGKPVLGIITPVYRKAFDKLTRDVFKGRSGVLEFEIVGLKGTHRWLETHAVPMRDAAGTIIALLGVTRNITERKKTEQELKRSEEKYRTLVEQAVDAIALYDASGKILDVNTGSVNLLGYTKKELIQMYLSDVLTKEEIQTRPVQYDVLQKGESTVKQRMMRRKDGSVVQTEVRSQQLPDGRFLSVIRDLTDRKKAEHELEESYKAIRRLTGHLQNIREDERAHMAREIHDELGQQLTVLKMDVSWLNKKISPTATDPVKQKMKDLLDMLNGTVKTVRRIASELRPSLLDDLGLVAAIEWQLAEFEKHSGIKTSFSEPGVDVKLPDDKKIGLFRIFQESLTNVARHAGATKIKISLTYNVNTIVLQIADNGKGFDKLKITGKRTLGILGMKERTSMIGGTYEITGTPGKGTTVLVTVPRDS